MYGAYSFYKKIRTYLTYAILAYVKVHHVTKNVPTIFFVL